MKMKFSSPNLQRKEATLKHRYTTQRDTRPETMLLYYARPHTPKLDVSPKSKEILDFSLGVTWLITLLNYAIK